ncbi:glycosyltransferase family 2 protein [Catalinimonas niigatensis]|uniref:glycosyltransferase family 2 protein n=1 Tax=Catalinimonas niigatensis TaxID=1397264 RepID=UPI002666FED0|nr:glycosyltransferase family 2 protein [Catalinimonas niigatensis]WPP50275.1 glycosyltransferase family 2 protein [Catalinimonas niigatensis]
MEKLVSVNITTFNRVNYLTRCLDSVLSQTYAHLEIVVVDDCSTDGTSKVMEHYTQLDSRIKYIRHEFNQGNAYARNTALHNCTGYYVAFMDDDDAWIDDEKISKQVQIFEDNTNPRLGIICSSVKIIDQYGKEQIKIEKHPDNLVSHILIQNGIIHNSTVLTKRSIMEDVEGFDIDMPKGIDAEFFRAVIVKHKYEVLFMPDVTTAYYIHEGVRMTTNNEKFLYKLFKVNARVIKKYFKAFLVHPKALYFRLYIVVRSLYKFMIYYRLQK